VLRTLSPRALANWRLLERKEFFAKRQAEGKIVVTRLTEDVLALPEAAACSSTPACRSCPIL
jgi:hypothetical protein